jgi:mannose-6-phosphate isomerase-like protein (cupin superfamily)
MPDGRMEHVVDPSQAALLMVMYGMVRGRGRNAGVYHKRESTMQVVNLAEKFSGFSEYWSPRIAGELNGQHVKLAKLKGEFIWHHHDAEDELFFVIKGSLRMEMRDKTVVINEGEFFIVPHGVEHRPVAEEEVHVMLFEPKSTLNTGNIRNDRTVEKPGSI